MFQNVISLDTEVKNIELIGSVLGKYAGASFVGELENRIHEISNIAFKIIIWTRNLI